MYSTYREYIFLNKYLHNALSRFYVLVYIYNSQFKLHLVANCANSAAAYKQNNVESKGFCLLYGGSTLYVYVLNSHTHNNADIQTKILCILTNTHSYDSVQIIFFVATFKITLTLYSIHIYSFYHFLSSNYNYPIRGGWQRIWWYGVYKIDI